MGAIGHGIEIALGRSRASLAAAFDFTGGTMPAGTSLTRASAGTRVNAAGVIVNEAANVARFGYDPVSLVSRGLMIEPAATNGCGFADGTVAQLSVSSGVTDAAGSLTGFVNAIRFADNAASRYAYKNLAAISGAYAFSLFVKMDDGSVPNVTGSSGSGDFRVTGVAAAPPTRTSVAGGGLYRLVWAGSGFAGGNVGPVKYAGQSARGFAVSGFQMEAGTGETSMILSGSGGATRAADVVTLNWAAKGVADGAIAARVTFDDGSIQDVAMTVSGGTATVPTALNRRWVRRIEKL